jgi:hypothetical protein
LQERQNSEFDRAIRSVKDTLEAMDQNWVENEEWNFVYQRVHVASAERLDVATPAEEMVNGAAGKLVVAELAFALQDAEVFLARDRLPEPALGAHRTIAAAGAFGGIELAFESHGAAVAAALMELFHRESPRG